ncbi:CRISPR-associated endonuclease Cas1 [Endozoicomonas montiporae]|uniref:CRISPR-associated endonuclease Cas1 n=1 Tax=Endozoicomonas montiporae TaxID=1027273 RepID=UPI0009E201CE|nr:CRISPR-associated endonuclease Cas1 [Endozoicomonas montiporae]
METLYITRKNTALSIRQGQLDVLTDDKRFSVNIDRLQRMFILADISLNTSILHNLSTHGVCLFFGNERVNSHPIAMVPEPVHCVYRRRGQYLRIAHEPTCLRQAKGLVHYTRCCSFT